MSSRSSTGTRDRRALPVLIAAFAAAVLSAGASAAEFSNGGPITIPDSGIAGTYPSTITVEGLDGVVSRVVVRIKGIEHDRPQDLDIQLRSPDGTTVVLFSDCTFDTLGISSFASLGVIIEDEALTTADDTEQFETNRFKPSNANVGPADSWPGPANPPPYQSRMDVFNGENPNGLWRLFVVDDAAGFAGEIKGGWSIEVETAQRFESAGPINTPSGVGGADAYPSVIDVQGLPNTVVEVRARIHGLDTTLSSGRFGILLRSPNGRAVLLFLGSPDTSSDLELCFTDRVMIPLLSFSIPPFLSPNLESGTYAPESLDDSVPALTPFPNPSPDAPYDVSLGRFSGIDPNGEWKLFVAGLTADVTPVHIDGWSLDFIYPGSAPAAPTCSGDADGDGDVDFDDLNLVLFNFASICL